MSVLDKIKRFFISKEESYQTVYKLCNHEELNDFLCKNTQNLGRPWNRVKKLNNHKYQEGVSYIHFFKNKEDMPFLRAGLSKREFVCEFSIPKSVLQEHIGKGRYANPSGYDFYTKKITEYALPTSKFNPDYFVKFTPINDFLKNDSEKLEP